MAYEVVGLREFQVFPVGEVTEEHGLRKWYMKLFNRFMSAKDVFERGTGLTVDIEEDWVMSFGVRKKVLNIKVPDVRFDMIDAVSSEYSTMIQELRAMEHYKKMCLLV